MSFGEPLFLLALVLVPLLLLARWAARRRSARHAIRYPGVAVLASVLTPGPAWKRIVPPVLLAAAVAALVLALARPEHTVAVPVEQASIVLILDTSRSMLARDVEPDRFDAARKAARTFMSTLPASVKVGLVAFSDAPYTVVRPTTDRQAIKDTLTSLTADGGTATGPAIRAAVDALPPDRATGRRPPSAIVLLSDGKATVGVDPVPEARRAGQAKIPVTTVALGSANGVVPGPFGQDLSVPPDPETLRQIAAVSGGQAFEVDDADRLQEVYRSLGSRLGTRPEQREITSAFAGGALVLLLAAVAAGVRWRVRLP